MPLAAQAANSETLSIPPYRTTLFVAGSGNVAFNVRFTELLKQQLGPTIRVGMYSRELSEARPDTLVVTLGAHALNRVQQQKPKPPTLSLMVDERQFVPYLDNTGPPVSAIYYNPPLLAQALLGHLILPQATHIAMLVRPGDESSYESFNTELAKFGLHLRVFVVDNDAALISTLARALSYGDFLLAMPDPAIYNPRTIKHILLTAYRRNRIVIGPNRAFVHAGALASVYAPIDVIIGNLVDYFETFKLSGQLPPPQYPSSFAIEVNRQVARSLNIPLPDTLEPSLRMLLNTLHDKDAP